MQGRFAGSLFTCGAQTWGQDEEHNARVQLTQARNMQKNVGLQHNFQALNIHF